MMLYTITEHVFSHRVLANWRKLCDRCRIRFMLALSLKPPPLLSSSLLSFPPLPFPSASYFDFSVPAVEIAPMWLRNHIVYRRV